MVQDTGSGYCFRRLVEENGAGDWFRILVQDIDSQDWFRTIVPETCVSKGALNRNSLNQIKVFPLRSTVAYRTSSLDSGVLVGR